MGTSRFAIPVLDRLLGGPHEVVAVVTAPDKPAGRSLRITEPPVKSFLHGHDIPILQPEDLGDPFFLKAAAGFEPDIAAVVAFRILPTEVFTIPRLGCVNLHASLLPELRGAAPIQWALMRGYETTGVTTFLIERKVDTGGVLLQESAPIMPDDDAESLALRLSEIGARVMADTLDGLQSGVLTPKQQVGHATSAPKIVRETALIDWNQPAKEIHNQVRGLSPEPAAFTVFESKTLKILKSLPTDSGAVGEPGEVVFAKDGRITVKTGTENLDILELQLEGKRRMNSSEFLRGRPVRIGTRLG